MTQPCWSCANACGGCEWSAKGEPIPGWEAEPRTIKYNDPKGTRWVHSFSITRCPKYEHDGKTSFNNSGIPAHVMREALEAVRRKFE